MSPDQMSTLDGNILTPQGWLLGQVSFAAGRIVDVSGTPVDPTHNDAPYILPGFIDLHVHGGGGADVMEGRAALDTMARLHALHGTTALLATTMTAPRAELQRVLTGLGEAVHGTRASGSARVLGVHLEGPYLNRERRGAQPDQTVAAPLAVLRDELRVYLRLAPIRVITLAPEVGANAALIAELAAQGVRVQLGHSAGSYDDGVAALRHGAAGFTHLFNAMTGLQHRAPGIAGAALAHAEYAELIPDLLHVHPGAIRVALRAIPKLYAVTDATAAAGMPDGTYQLGSRTVCHCLGAVRLADGTLAGSALTMHQAFVNLASLGLPLADISNRLSRYPADYLGLAERGRLAAGAWADMVVIDRTLALCATLVEGERIEPAAASTAAVPRVPPATSH